MSSITSHSPDHSVRPRPGVVKTLGVVNIILSVFSALFLMTTVFSIVLSLAQLSAPEAKVEAAVVASTTTKPATKAGTPAILMFNPFMGMNDPNYFWFNVVQAGTGLVLTGLMFATGIGLINLHRWAARWWSFVSWVSIVWVVLMAGYWIVGVAPSLSANVAKEMVGMFQRQGLSAARAPTVAEMTRIYSIMFLIMGLMLMVFGPIYPALSVWLLSRRGIKAALVGGKNPMEVELL